MSNLFYKYYDILFTSKDYEEEVFKSLEIAKKYLNHEPKNILEIGCGTGSHTLELAKLNIPITSIDVDQEMITRCREKIKENNISNVEIYDKRIQDLDLKDFDICFSLFNVVTYIPKFNELVSFFNAIYNSLSDDSVYIFDCWNGSAAVLDTPKGKEYSVKNNNEEINCKLESNTDFINQKTTLRYNLRVTKENGEVIEDKYDLDQYLWTPNQIKDALGLAGFTKFECYENFNLNEVATDKHWKIMFVCQK